MPDLLDRAAELEAAQRQAALAAQAARTPAPADGTPDCINCGELIPAARRAALPSACRCITCQQRAERSGHVR